MDNRRKDGPDERQRLARLLAWRQIENRVRETPARRILSHVAAVAWFAVGLLTVTLVTTLTAAQRPGKGSVAATGRPASREIPLTGVEPALLMVERGPRLGAPSVSPAGPPRVGEAGGGYARPERSPQSAPRGRKASSPLASVRRHGTAAPLDRVWPLTTTVATVRRWVGYLPEARVGQGVVRWVKSQGPADGRRLAEPERPQAR